MAWRRMKLPRVLAVSWNSNRIGAAEHVTALCFNGTQPENGGENKDFTVRGGKMQMLLLTRTLLGEVAVGGASLIFWVRRKTEILVICLILQIAVVTGCNPTKPASKTEVNGIIHIL